MDEKDLATWGSRYLGLAPKHDGHATAWLRAAACGSGMVSDLHLSGPQGIGKSTAAQVLCRHLGCMELTDGDKDDRAHPVVVTTRNVPDRAPYSRERAYTMVREPDVEALERDLPELIALARTVRW